MNRNEEDTDPISSVANLFDVAMVFAVALMVALVTRFSLTEMLTRDDFTMVKNPGEETMEIITKKGEEITRYRHNNNSENPARRGKRIGVAYELENGEIIYIPEGESSQ